MTVTKWAYHIALSDEDIVDYSIGTPEEQAAAAARIDARRQESERRWKALPIWTRVWRRARWRLYGPSHRLRHAWMALRGADCR